LELIQDNQISRRKTIIYIRNYYYNFKDTKKLNSIFGVTEKQRLDFIRNLNFLSEDDLNNTLELIRFEISISKNYTNFNNILESALRSIETISTKFFNIDVSGSADELLKDEDFIDYLKCISSEIDISEYIDNKKCAFFKALSVFYKKYYMNKNKAKLSETVNNIKNVKIDNDIINKFQSLPSINVNTNTINDQFLNNPTSDKFNPYMFKK